MTNEERIERFHEIVNDMANLYAKKNRNYGNSFGELYDEWGDVAGVIPLHNKFSRIKSLVKGTQNNFESLEDSLKDLACYSIMFLIELENCRHEAMLDIEPIGQSPEGAND